MLDVQMRPGSEMSLPLDSSFGVLIYILEVIASTAPLVTWRLFLLKKFEMKILWPLSTNNFILINSSVSSPFERTALP